MDMDCVKLLEHSFDFERATAECGARSRLEYLSDHIFDFTTYDSEMGELFASKAVEVCAAINDRTTFDYIKDADNYRWYLLMCNMPFFCGRLDWGTSIRGAWWNYDIEFQSCGLWEGDKQLVDTIKFDNDGWIAFIAAVIQFAAADPARADSRPLVGPAEVK